MEIKTSRTSLAAGLALHEKIAKSSWEYRQHAFRILDNIYYVGNKWVAAYLIDTGEGLIMIDTTFKEVQWLLFDAIREAGFDPADIKLLLLTHAHFDHIGGARFIQEVSNCVTYMSEDDLYMVEDRPELMFGEVDEFKIDHFYDYNGTISLGNVVIRPVKTPGHTAGCTSLFFEHEFQGKKYTIAAHGGIGNAGMATSELKEMGLPVSLQNQYLDGLRNIAQIPVDVFLPLHNSYYDILSLAEQDDGSGSIYIQPGIWAQVMESRAQFFEKMLEDEANEEASK